MVPSVLGGSADRRVRGLRLFRAGRKAADLKDGGPRYLLTCSL
jgi:hypothetical protein